MKKISSLLLFPQSPESLLSNQEMKLKTLRFLNFFINEIVESIKLFFVDKKLISFDSHVGETLCQIRAYKTLLIAKNKDDFQADLNLENFRKIKQKIKQKILDFTLRIKNKNGRYDRFLDQAETINEFLARSDLIFDLPQDVFYLVQSKILASYSIRDEFNLPIAINYEQLSQKLGCGKTMAKKIARYFQSNLSNASCEFIGMLLNDLPELFELRKILPYIKLVDNHRRNVLPCYEVTRVLMLHIHQAGCPILMIVHRQFQDNKDFDTIPLLFVPSKINNDFELCQDLYSDNLENPCFVIRGITCYADDKIIESHAELISRFTKIGLCQIILANMAKHPQFSAEEFDFLSDDPYKFLLESKELDFDKCVHYKKLNIKTLLNYGELIELLLQRVGELLKMQHFAELYGCCERNSTLFFVKHIYCDVLKNQLSKNFYIKNADEDMECFKGFQLCLGDNYFFPATLQTQDKECFHGFDH